MYSSSQLLVSHGLTLFCAGSHTHLFIVLCGQTLFLCRGVTAFSIGTTATTHNKGVGEFTVLTCTEANNSNGY